MLNGAAQSKKGAYYGHAMYAPSCKSFSAITNSYVASTLFISTWLGIVTTAASLAFFVPWFITLVLTIMSVVITIVGIKTFTGNFKIQNDEYERSVRQIEQLYARMTDAAKQELQKWLIDFYRESTSTANLDNLNSRQSKIKNLFELHVDENNELDQAIANRKRFLEDMRKIREIGGLTQ